jgi:hypothetical protein
MILLLLIGCIYGQTSFQGNCIDYENNIPVLAEVKLIGYSENSYSTITDNKGQFYIMDVDSGYYKLSIEPLSDTVIYDSINYDLFEDKPSYHIERRDYCKLEKDSIFIDSLVQMDLYMLYYNGGVFHMDGFPISMRLFGVIPIPFIKRSYCGYEVSNGTVEKYSISETKMITITKGFTKLHFWKHIDERSLHDIYYPVRSDTMHYHCVAGDLYWFK